jgi:hypothetical protein
MVVGTPVACNSLFSVKAENNAEPPELVQAQVTTRGGAEKYWGLFSKASLR